MRTPRYEREIRSILEKLPDFLPDSPTPRSGMAPRPAPRPSRRGFLNAQGWLLRDAYAMAALLIVLARWGQGLLGPAGAHLIAWIAVVLFVAALASSVVRFFAGSEQPKMWRGKPITYQPPAPPGSLMVWLRRFFGGTSGGWGPGAGGRGGRYRR